MGFVFLSMPPGTTAITTEFGGVEIPRGVEGEGVELPNQTEKQP